MAANTSLLMVMNRKYGVKIPTRVRYFLVSKISRLAVLPTLPKFHTYWSSFLEVKRPRPETVHSPISSAEVKNEWSSNTTPPTPCSTLTSLPSFLRYSSTLKMGAVGSCEMFVPFCLTIKAASQRAIFFFVDTATRCISNLTYRLTCHAIRTFRKVTPLSSLVRVQNGGGTYLTNTPSRRQNQRCDNLKYQG